MPKIVIKEYDKTKAIANEYANFAVVDENGLVGAAVERERKRLLTQAKEQTNG